jgi:hypothetical protein
MKIHTTIGPRGLFSLSASSVVEFSGTALNNPKPRLDLP